MSKNMGEKEKLDSSISPDLGEHCQDLENIPYLLEHLRLVKAS